MPKKTKKRLQEAFRRRRRRRKRQFQTGGITTLSNRCWHPGLYREYCALERRIGHTLSPTRVPLPELTGVPVNPAAPSRLHARRLRIHRCAAPSVGP